MNLFRIAPTLATCLTLATAAQAQIQVIATESFDYAFPSVLDGNGGTGWSTPWGPSPGGVCVMGQHSHCPAGPDDVVIQANPPVHTANPFPFPGADNVGNYAQQANEFGRWIRSIDPTGHDDVMENGQFGKDGTTIWVSFTMQIFVTGGVHDGGIFLSQAGVWECEPGMTAVLLGSLWGQNQYGADWNVGSVNPPAQTLIPGSFDTTATRIVTRLDYAAGPDRIRMWLDPAVPHPTTAADLDVTVTEERPWDELRLASGGGGSLAYWDNIVIEKEVTGIGTNYCLSLPNSTGNSAEITALGSLSVAAQNLELQTTGMPPGVSGIFYYGTGMNLVGFGDGFRCVGGTVQRLPIQSADASGFMAQTVFGNPMPNVPITPTTLFFQAWFRDPPAMMTGFNLSDGVMVTFLP